MLIEEVITEEELKEFLPAVLGGIARIGMGLGRTALRGAKGLGRFAVKNPLRRIGLGIAGHKLASFFAKDPEAKKMHDIFKTTDDEQERERLRLELEGRIKHWEEDMDTLFPTWRESVEAEITEEAKSKAQQRFMGMVHAVHKGEKPASKEIAKVAKGMKKKDADDFASTKHKGLPNHA
jgi:hypothetical protein